MHTLKSVVELLSQHHQRATYGAVAGLLGTVPRSLMAGCPRDWRHSWVVNQESGLPTEYPEPKIHPAIAERDDILDTEEKLVAWLADPK